MISNTALKSLRGKKLKTQQEVADLLNVSRQTYVNYETSVLNVDLETCLEILKVLDANEQEATEFFNALKQDYLSYKKDV